MKHFEKKIKIKIDLYDLYGCNEQHFRWERKRFTPAPLELENIFVH